MSDVTRIVEALSPSMIHVLRRCSFASWGQDERTVGRQWLDLVYGRPHVGIATVHALVARGLLYEDFCGFGMTHLGFAVRLALPHLLTSTTPTEEREGYAPPPEGGPLNSALNKDRTGKHGSEIA